MIVDRVAIEKSVGFHLAVMMNLDIRRNSYIYGMLFRDICYFENLLA